MLNKIRKHFMWSFHNIVCHPLMEMAHLIGLEKLSLFIHDASTPE